MRLHFAQQVLAESSVRGMATQLRTNQIQEACAEAFAGLCMGIVKSTKQAGEITVEISSPGLQSASATLSARPVTVQPQVPVWQRSMPMGEGVTGLWRPVTQEGPNGPDPSSTRSFWRYALHIHTDWYKHSAAHWMVRQRTSGQR